MHIGIISKEDHAKSHQKALERLGHRVQLLGATHTLLPPTLDVLICRPASSSHQGFELAMSEKRSGRPVIIANGVSEIVKAVTQLAAPPVVKAEAPVAPPAKRKYIPPGHSTLDSYRHLVGTTPDKEVARIVGMSQEGVRQYRRKNNIPASWTKVAPVAMTPVAVALVAVAPVEVAPVAPVQVAPVEVAPVQVAWDTNLRFALSLVLTEMRVARVTELSLTLDGRVSYKREELIVVVTDGNLSLPSES